MATVPISLLVTATIPKTLCYCYDAMTMAIVIVTAILHPAGCISSSKWETSLRILIYFEILCLVTTMTTAAAAAIETLLHNSSN